jgi:hypothetical protein
MGHVGVANSSAETISCRTILRRCINRASVYHRTALSENPTFSGSELQEEFVQGANS